MSKKPGHRHTSSYGSVTFSDQLDEEILIDLSSSPATTPNYQRRTNAVVSPGNAPAFPGASSIRPPMSSSIMTSPRTNLRNSNNNNTAATATTPPAQQPHQQQQFPQQQQFSQQQQFLLNRQQEETLSLHKVVEDFKRSGGQQQQYLSRTNRNNILRNSSGSPAQQQRHYSDPTAALLRRDNSSNNSNRSSSNDNDMGRIPESTSELSFRMSDSKLPSTTRYAFDSGSEYSSNGGGGSEVVGLIDDNPESIFPSFHHRWLPDCYETDLRMDIRQHQHSPSFRPVPRSLKRRLFLFLSEPTTSIGAAILFFILILAIALMNILMVVQTMNHWQFTPDDCITCGGDVKYVFDDDAIEGPINPDVPCVCPPTPVEWTNVWLKYLIYFFTMEWILRVVLFAPPQDSPRSFWGQWFAHLTETTTILDALAIFPYYLETLDGTNGLMSLRLLRLFRVFQLLRLGQYNTTFLSLTNVLFQSMLYLKLLVIALIFGAALFGSLMYWLEKGSWKYHHESHQYRFMRISVDGITEEPSPFTSIPAAFWWFIVTATTCGYGDVYPTTTGGKWVAVFAMMLGVLVVAFPVSVFSELWSREVSKLRRHYGQTDDGLDDATDNNAALSKTNADGEEDEDDESLNAIYYSTKARDVDTLLSSLHLSRSSSMRPEDSPGPVTSEKRGSMSAPPPSTRKQPTAADPTPRASNLQTQQDSTQPLQDHPLPRPRRSRDRDIGDAVIMSQNEMDTILSELDAMRQSEIRIRSLINRYKMQSASY